MRGWGCWGLLLRRNVVGTRLLPPAETDVEVELDDEDSPFFGGQLVDKWPLDLQRKQLGIGLSNRYIALYSSEIVSQDTERKSALRVC